MRAFLDFCAANCPLTGAIKKGRNPKISPLFMLEFSAGKQLRFFAFRFSTAFRLNNGSNSQIVIRAFLQVSRDNT